MSLVLKTVACNDLRHKASIGQPASLSYPIKASLSFFGEQKGRHALSAHLLRALCTASQDLWRGIVERAIPIGSLREVRVGQRA